MISIHAEHIAWEPMLFHFPTDCIVCNIFPIGDGITLPTLFLALKPNFMHLAAQNALRYCLQNNIISLVC